MNTIIVGLAVATCTAYLIKKYCFGRKVEVTAGTPKVQSTSSSVPSASASLTSRDVTQKTEITEHEHINRMTELEQLNKSVHKYAKETMKIDEFVRITSSIMDIFYKNGDIGDINVLFNTDPAVGRNRSCYTGCIDVLTQCVIRLEDKSLPCRKGQPIGQYGQQIVRLIQWYNDAKKIGSTDIKTRVHESFDILQPKFKFVD